VPGGGGSVVNRSEHIAALRAASGALAGNDRLLLAEWSNDSWNKLLDRTQSKPFRTSEVVIQRGALDRALHFVVAGTLEVGVTQVDGVSISALAKITAGSIVGEQSFFDGQPRSTNVYAISDGELLRFEYDEFLRFSHDEPELTRDLLFAMGRILSSRLRNTTVRVRR